MLLQKCAVFSKKWAKNGKRLRDSTLPEKEKRLIGIIP